MTVKIVTGRESGAVLFIPLNKLKKSPKNARKAPYSEADVEALAARVAVSTSKLARIRELNDNLRLTFGGGKIMTTASVAALGHELKAAAFMELGKFSAFDLGNDPHHEHDFGSFELGHYTFLFKIDYYDNTLEFASEDPSDPDKTTRVLTLMLAEDY